MLFILFFIILTSCMYVKDITVSVTLTNSPGYNGTLEESYYVDGILTKNKEVNGTSQRQRRFNPKVVVNVGNKSIVVPTDLTATIPASLLQ